MAGPLAKPKARLSSHGPSLRRADRARLHKPDINAPRESDGEFAADRLRRRPISAISRRTAPGKTALQAPRRSTAAILAIRAGLDRRGGALLWSKGEKRDRVAP